MKYAGPISKLMLVAVSLTAGCGPSDIPTTSDPVSTQRVEERAPTNPGAGHNQMVREVFGRLGRELRGEDFNEHKFLLALERIGTEYEVSRGVPSEQARENVRKGIAVAHALDDSRTSPAIDAMIAGFRQNPNIDRAATLAVAIAERHTRNTVRIPRAFSRVAQTLEDAADDLILAVEDSLTEAADVLVNTDVIVSAAAQYLSSGDHAELVDYEFVADSSREYWEWLAVDYFIETEGGGPPPDLRAAGIRANSRVIACPWCLRVAGRQAVIDFTGYMGARAAGANHSGSFGAAGWASLGGSGGLAGRVFRRPPPGGWNWN